ncbi:MAG: DNA modification methylase [Sphingomicrobium sp.]
MTEPKLRLEWLDPADLKDHPQNWRRHPHRQQRALRDALQEVGWAGALLYNQRTGRLIDGHLRKKIARKGEKVPVLVGSWSEADEAKILATLDPITSLAETDQHALEELLGLVRTESSAITSLLESLAGAAALECMVAPGELKEPPEQIERADEFAAKWRTALGQLWQVGPHWLLCGDSCLDGLVSVLFSRGERLRLVWVDPPYGVNLESKTRWMAQRGAQRRRGPIKNDTLGPAALRQLFGQALKLAARFAAPGAALYATVPSGSLLPYFIAGLEDGGFTFRQSLVWCKNAMVLGRGDYHYRHETILYAWLENGPHYFCSDRTRDSVFEVDRPHASPFHPTTKPIELVAQMILNSSRKGEVVYDPFCGSGTTLLACHQLGRIGFGVDLDPRYVAAALERLSLLGLQPQLIADGLSPAQNASGAPQPKATLRRIT